MSFWSRFSDHATRQPGLEAILAPGRSPLRYAELPSRLDAVRRALNACGIGRGDLVVVVLPKGPEMAVCMLGITSCAIAVPLNPEYSADEFSRYLQRIRPEAAVLAAGMATAARGQAAALGIPVIDLVADLARPAGTFELSGGVRADPERPGWNSADDVALILLTSGSTGRPKMVPERQHHLLAYGDAIKQMYDLGPADRSVHAMPMFHGHGVKSSLVAPLVLGAGVVCPDRFDVPSFFSCVEQFRPTWYSAGYTVHHTILDQIDPYRATARAARLRFIRSGSGRLDPRIMLGLEAAFGAPVLERYGMSETATLTYNPLPPAVRKPGTVGIPSVNEVRVIDEHGAALGPNRQGEVVARGPTVFDGYWDDPDANAASFIDGWFRTGDLGHFDDDGYLTITGRAKDLINRGGEKFSPVEVEAVLLEHPGVRAACVFAISHPTLGEEVGAAVVPAGDGGVTEQGIQAHARTRLVAFKIPRRVFLCASLPKGGSGKVHRATVAQMCLATLAETGSSSEASAREPSALEAEILTLWNAVLKTRTLELDQDFFLAGGDSLKAADLFARIRLRLGVTLGLRQLFEDAATVSGIARLVAQARDRGSSQRALPAGLVPIKTDGDRLPLFAVPGSGGNPVGFVHLGRLLDPRRPLYGIESVGLDGAAEPIDRMEQIAAENIRRLRALQPHGPYYLTGACFGGRVAFEMARQIAGAGERVGLLILLDPSPPFTDGEGRPRGQRAERGKPRKPFHAAGLVLDRMALHARNLVRLRGSERRAYLREKLRIVGEMIAQRDPFRGDRSELIQRAVYAANRRAGRAYLPGPFHGPTILCFTRDRPSRGARNFREDWLALVPQCGGPIYVAGRDSGDMLNLPHVYELAECVKTWLASADAHAPEAAPAAALEAAA